MYSQLVVTVWPGGISPRSFTHYFPSPPITNPLLKYSVFFSPAYVRNAVEMIKNAEKTEDKAVRRSHSVNT